MWSVLTCHTRAGHTGTSWSGRPGTGHGMPGTSGTSECQDLFPTGSLRQLLPSAQNAPDGALRDHTIVQST